jgi:hypothetical protein
MTRFRNNHEVCSKSKRLESQIIFKLLGAIKLKGLNRIAEISYGHPCLREESLSFDKNYVA